METKLDQPLAQQTQARTDNERRIAQQSAQQKLPQTSFGAVLSNGRSSQSARTTTPSSTVVAAAVAGTKSTKARASGSTSSSSSSSSSSSDSSSSTDSSSSSSETLLAETQAMQETNNSFNLQYLQLQESMQQDNREFTTLSNIMKTKHDTAKNSINNVR